MRLGETNGKQYHFSNTITEMRFDIMANQYVEHGWFNGHLYGTKLESIKAVIRQGKTCLLDCGPSVSLFGYHKGAKKHAR